MDDDTLESFQFSQFGDENDFLHVALEPQCEPLRIGEDSVLSILAQSSALEVFQMSIDYESEFEILLNSLASEPWASTKIRELQLYLTRDDEQQDPEPSEIRFSDPMPRWTRGLESFYCQIGLLTDVRILDLTLAVEKDSRHSHSSFVSYKGNTFTEMLNQEDRATGHLGWLQLLAGLGNLEEV
ncbi:hypothetical protein BGX23_007455 [Mortierella sp. AD031]|nr:hypothetical protein BGX23_007455 [Mortierella sp. AD031]KAG0219806.1 hypothetical protein BGX33_000649 [Mortierella sp. NVP41]